MTLVKFANEIGYDERHYGTLLAKIRAFKGR